MINNNEEGIDMLNIGQFGLISSHDAYDLMVDIRNVLREKLPCPICEGDCFIDHTNEDDDGRKYQTQEVCIGCNGTGIHIPESEA